MLRRPEPASRSRTPTSNSIVTVPTVLMPVAIFRAAGGSIDLNSYSLESIWRARAQT